MMYAIIFDFNNQLNNNLNQIKLIKDFMLENNFIWKGDNIYFGSSSIDAVTCVLTIQKLSQKYVWISEFIRDIRMLRIEENTDLLRAIS